MYNGVGLSSARGSGTSAHVSRNSAALRRQRTYPRHVVKKNDNGRKRTKAAEQHERRRAIEVKVAEFDSRNDKLRRALGLPEEYEEGAAFRKMKKDDIEKDAVTAEKKEKPNSATTAAQQLADNSKSRAEDDDLGSESSSSLSSSSLSSSSGIGKEADEKAASKANGALVEGRSARRAIPNPTADWLKNNVNFASVPHNNIRALPRDTTTKLGSSNNSTMQNRRNPTHELDQVHRKRAGLPPIRPTSQNVKISNSLQEVHRRRAGLPPSMHLSRTQNESRQEPPIDYGNGIGNSSRYRSAEKELDDVHRRRAGLSNITKQPAGIESRETHRTTEPFYTDTEMKPSTERPKRPSRFGNRRMSISPSRDEIHREKRDDRVEERAGYVVREHRRNDGRRDGRDGDVRGGRYEKEDYDRRNERDGNERDGRWGRRCEKEGDDRREDSRGNTSGSRREDRGREGRYRARSRSSATSRSRSRSPSRDSYRRTPHRRRRRRRSPSLSPPRERRSGRVSRETLRRRVVESMKKSSHGHRNSPSPRYSSSSRSRSRTPTRRDRRREPRRRRRSRTPVRSRSPSLSRSRTRSRSRTPRRMSPGEQKRELEFRMRKLKRRQRGRSESASSASSRSRSSSRSRGACGNNNRYRSRSPERKRRHL